MWNSKEIMTFAFSCSVHIVVSMCVLKGMETRKGIWKLSQEERENTDGRKKRSAESLNCTNEEEIKLC